MSKKYNRYRASTSGLFLDDRWAFEVIGNRIITYKTHTEGIFWWKKRIYNQSASVELTPDLIVRVWAKEGSSGNCEVKGNAYIDDYHILHEVEEFARDVRQAINILVS